MGNVMRSAAESEGSVGLPSRRPAGCWTFGTEVRMRDGPETVRGLESENKAMVVERIARERMIRARKRSPRDPEDTTI